MQATITYLLTEQAQRAQMAATGQPVARKQTITIEAANEDITLMDVAENGALSLNAGSYRYTLVAAGWTDEAPPCCRVFGADVLADIRRGKKLRADSRKMLIDAATAYCLAHEEMMAERPTDILHIPQSAAPGVDNDIARHMFGYNGEMPNSGLNEWKWETYTIYVSALTPECQAVLLARHQAKQESDRLARLAAIDAFFADPAARLKPTYKGAEMGVKGVKIADRQEGYARLYEEVMRRNQADADAKAAKDAVIEQAKTDAIEAFVRASGDALLQQQYDDDLLCRKTVVSRMAEQALDDAGLPGKCEAPAVCEYSDCPCRDNGVECIPPNVYVVWQGIGPLLEGYFVDFHEVRECLRECLRDDDGNSRGNDGDDTVGPTEYHAIVTIPSGPFLFTRRIKL